MDDRREVLITGCGSSLEMLKGLPSEMLVELRDKALEMMRTLEESLIQPQETELVKQAFRMPTFDLDGPRQESRLTSREKGFVEQSKTRRRHEKRVCRERSGRVLR
jgi:hypothetical protein